MTKQEYYQMAISKLDTLSTNDIVNQLQKMKNDFSDAANLITEVGLDILMNRMTTKDFVQFCDTL